LSDSNVITTDVLNKCVLSVVVFVPVDWCLLPHCDRPSFTPM